MRDALGLLFIVLRSAVIVCYPFQDLIDREVYTLRSLQHKVGEKKEVALSSNTQPRATVLYKGRRSL
jgi:hypothetical protein